MSVKLDTNTIRLINLFELLSGVEVEDCIVDGKSAYFLVKEGKAGLVIGKNGRNIRKLQEKLNKRIKIYERKSKIEDFIESISSIKPNRIEIKNENGGKIVEIEVDRNKKSMLMGKNSINLKLMRRFLKRLFGIDDVRIIT